LALALQLSKASQVPGNDGKLGVRRRIFSNLLFGSGLVEGTGFKPDPISRETSALWRETNGSGFFVFTWSRSFVYLQPHSLTSLSIELERI